METAWACVQAIQREKGVKKQTVIKPSASVVLQLMGKMELLTNLCFKIVNKLPAIC